MSKPQESSSTNSFSAPPPAVVRTRTNLGNDDDNNSNTVTITSTSTNSTVISPSYNQSKQIAINLRRQASQSATTEDNTQWLSRVRKVQLSAMTPEQRDEMRRKNDEQADRLAQAKRLHSISHRTQNAKTTSYFAMDQEHVRRGRQSTALSAQLAPAPTTSLIGGANQQQQQQQQQLLGVALPSAPPSAPASRSEQASALMKMMEEDDEAITTSFSVPERRKKAKSSKPMVKGQVNDAMDDIEEENEEEQAHKRRPVFAMREEAQLTTSIAWNQQQMEGNEKINESEEQAALRSLQKEPNSDDERAAKFEVFEKFSDKMMKIRKDLDDTINETVVELPPLPQQAIKQSVKKLESDKCRGIYDQSRFWFVHDMFQTASKNCDLMNEISEEVARKLRMIANNSQTECPVCLLTFEGVEVENNVDGNGEEEPKVEPVVLSCLHKMCEECFEQWKKIKGDRVYCPLCRNEEFLKDIAAVGIPE